MQDVKMLRKQLKNVIQDNMAEMLSIEVKAEIERKVVELFKERLDKIEQTQKQLVSYIIRNSSK